MSNELRICISSPPDREKLVAEIFFGANQWAELNQEHDTLRLEFYPLPTGEFWQLNLDEVVGALEEARRRLLNG
jgi:hypothetical protein